MPGCPPSGAGCSTHGTPPGTRRSGLPGLTPTRPAPVEPRPAARPGQCPGRAATQRVQDLEVRAEGPRRRTRGGSRTRWSGRPPAAPAQLHPDPQIRSERPAFDLHYPHTRSGRDRRPVSPPRPAAKPTYRQPGQDEAARGSYERGWPARPAGRGDGRDTRQRVGGKRQGWGCRLAYRIHRGNPQPPGARAARHQDCFPRLRRPRLESARPASCFLLSHFVKMK